jgi:hypothetical protein
VTGRAADKVTWALDRALVRCAGLLAPGRRGWADAVRAEAGEVPAGRARLGWVAGGLWLVAREAQMVRRILYGLGVAAVAVAAVAVMRYLWSGANAGRDAEWDKARVLLLVALLAGLPWVARRRGVFGPVGASIAARVVRAGGCAAVLVLVLDIARLEHFRGPFMPRLGGGTAPAAWGWAREAAGLGLIAACLAAVLIVTARWPQVSRVLVGFCAVAAGLALFITVAPVQVLITVYVAGIFALTSRRSLVTPATLAIAAGIGVGGGLLVVALWNPTRSSPAPGLAAKTDVRLLFVILGVTIVAGIAVAGMVAARRVMGQDDPLALRRARYLQYLAAGPLTGATAALMLPLLRASAAVHYAATCPAARAGHCTAAAGVWVLFLLAGLVLGLAFGSFGGWIVAAQPPPPPLTPPREPRPGGSRSGGVYVSNA